MKKIPLEKALTVALIFCGFASFGADTKAKLKYLKALGRSEAKADILHIRLDSEIYDATSTSLNDIRIFDASGREVPFVLRVDDSAETRIETRYNAMKIANLKRLESNELELILDAPEKLGEICGIEIRSSSINFEKELLVECSDDLSVWEILCSGSIFDYSELTALSNLKVKFPPRKASRHYRVRIANFAEGRKSPRSELISEKRSGSDFSVIEKIVVSTEPLKIDAVGLLTQFERIVKQVNRKVNYPVINFQVREIDRSTEISFSTRMEPLQTATIRTSSANFARECRVSASDDGKQWRDIPDAGGKISSIDLSGYKDSNLSVRLGGRNRHYRITVLNGDSPPLKINGLDLSGNVHMIEFIADKALSLQGMNVYYGGDNVPAPSYDTKEIIGRLKNPTTADLSIGAERPNPEYTGKAPVKIFINSRNAFFVAIGIMLAILSWILFKSFRKIESLPDE